MYLHEAGVLVEKKAVQLVKRGVHNLVHQQPLHLLWEVGGHVANLVIHIGDLTSIEQLDVVVAGVVLEDLMMKGGDPNKRKVAIICDNFQDIFAIVREWHSWAGGGAGCAAAAATRRGVRGTHGG